ncbi:MAG: hypothetical protein K0U34_06260 [Alphaproteobacteria bacterium]|nr:hypothetical protein [Alphaproteobacteria bacterium]
MRSFARTWTLAAALAAGLMVSGCGFGVDDVELNGGIFDALGVGSNSQKVARDDVKLKPRAPLVLPPGVERLPEPGTSIAAADPNLLTIQDPDQIATKSQAELEKAQQEYCDKHYNEYHQGSEFVNGPLGPCRKSVMTSIKKWNAEP